MPSRKPVMADELHRVLTDLGIEIRNPSGGGRMVAVIDGTEVPIPRPQRKREVPPHTLALVARAGGFHSYSDLLASLLSRDPIKAGRPSQPAQAQTGWSRSDVLGLCEKVASKLTVIGGWARAGRHDEQVYRKLATALSAALGELRDWPPAEGTWSSPDDTRYRPAQTDSVLTGVARATGLTARAVRRRETLTRWQHDNATNSEEAS